MVDKMSRQAGGRGKGGGRGVEVEKREEKGKLAGKER